MAHRSKAIEPPTVPNHAPIKQYTYVLAWMVVRDNNVDKGVERTARATPTRGDGTNIRGKRTRCKNAEGSRGGRWGVREEEGRRERVGGNGGEGKREGENMRFRGVNRRGHGLPS